MGILSFLTGGTVKSVVEVVKDIADEFITTDEERFEMLLKKEQLNLERERIYLEDTQSARRTYAEVSTSDKAPFINKVFPSILALVTVAATFFLFYRFAVGEIGTENKDIILYILGTLNTITAQIFAFYFGSSIGSKIKDDTLNKIIYNNKR